MTDNTVGVGEAVELTFRRFAAFAETLAGNSLFGESRRSLESV